MLQPDEQALAADAAAAWDRVATERSADPHAAMTEAKARIVALRDKVIARLRREGAAPGAELTAVNAALSLAWSAQFPQVGVRWKRMEQTRDALRALAERSSEPPAPAT